MRHLNARRISKSCVLFHPTTGVVHYKGWASDSPVCLSEYKVHDMTRIDGCVVTCIACIAQGEER